MSTEPPSVPNPIIEIADFFSRAPSREEIARFELSEATHQYVSHLLEKQDEGTLTAEEQRFLDEMLTLNDLMTLIRTRIRADL